jgi:hypothetical protein
VNFAKAVTVFLASQFTATVTDGFVLIAPGFQPRVDTVLIGVDERTCSNGRLDNRLDGGLLNIFQHV